MAVNYSLLQISTFGLALLGSVLGVINTWKALEHDKVKLKVIPKNAIPVGELENCGVDFCIEVINKSTFAITITEIGFLLKGLKERAAIYQPIIIDNGPFPRTLESRSSFTGYILKNSIAKIPKSTSSKLYIISPYTSKLSGIFSITSISLFAPFLISDVIFAP